MATHHPRKPPIPRLRRRLAMSRPRRRHLRHQRSKPNPRLSQSLRRVRRQPRRRPPSWNSKASSGPKSQVAAPQCGRDRLPLHPSSPISAQAWR
jgi:hypothetical protein